MVILKLAYRNLVGAGLRTWLSVGILSFIYVLIIWQQGLFNGMLAQASRDYIHDEIGGGQYWVKGYDPYDPLSLDEAHAPVAGPLRELIAADRATAVLIRQGTIYPQGRALAVLIKGIAARQTILDLPTRALDAPDDGVPIMIGPIMAAKSGLQTGDTLVLRWRDANGTFDAVDGRISVIMDTRVPTIDAGQIWIDLARLQAMTNLTGQATMVIVDRQMTGGGGLQEIEGWEFKGHDALLQDLRSMVRSKRFGSAMLYFILLLLAVLAIFDAQILSIFRRKKEIGTLMALGMVRSRVVALFTLEGALHGVLALAAAAVYGIPLLVWSARAGIPLPVQGQDYGFALAPRLFPVYSIWLLAGTVGVIMLTVTIVSYLPSRSIAHMTPTQALKGKRA